MHDSDESGIREHTATGRHWLTGEYVRLTFAGERIRKVEQIESGGGSDGDNGSWIAPGMIDLQLNGYGGYDLNAIGAGMEQRVETVKRLVRRVLASGTTSFCPTIITGGFSHIRSCMTAIRLACEEDPLTAQTVAGIHLEGPYISGEDGPRGAHPREHVKDPDLSEFIQWQEAADGRIRIVTLAPERHASAAFIRKLTEDGILVSIGHSAADQESIDAAVEAGARMSTHLGNGSHVLIPRHPNYIWSQLAEDRLEASIICDGHHLDASVVKVFARVKADRLVLVSDAAHLAGMQPGRYRTHVGGEVDLLPSGRLQLATNPRLLAGAAVSLIDCVERYVEFTGASLAEAVRKATALPAGLLGLTDSGEIKEGGYADLTVFRWNGETKRISMQAVYKRGRRFEPESGGNHKTDRQNRMR